MLASLQKRRLTKLLEWVNKGLVKKYRGGGPEQRGGGS